MKTLFGLTVVAAMICSSCIAQSDQGMIDDGIYYSTPGKSASTNQTAQPSGQTATNTSTQNNNPNSYTQQNPNNGQNYGGDSGNTSNYYSDDYYDYGYSARIRRYDNDWGNWGYYDNVYTNEYMYTGDPNQYGMSIYMGDPYMGPYAYSPYMWGIGAGWGFGFGWGYSGWGFGFGWGNPYWGWGGYWGGGYWGGGYYGGGCGGYYNSYEGGGYVRPGTGGRPSFGGGATPVTVFGASGNPVKPPMETQGAGHVSSFGQLYQNAVRSQASKNPSAFVGMKSGNSTSPIHVAAPVSTSRYAGSGVSGTRTSVPINYSSGRSASNNGNYSRSGNTTSNNNRGNYSRSYSSGNTRPNTQRSNNYGSRSNSNGSSYHPSYSGRSSNSGSRGSSYGGSRSYSGGGHSSGGGGGSHSSGGGGGSHSSGGGGSHSSGGGRR